VVPPKFQTQLVFLIRCNGDDRLCSQRSWKWSVSKDTFGKVSA